MARSPSSSSQPCRQATSSMHPIFSPCRSSTTETNSVAWRSDANVPVSSQAVPVDVGDLQLAAGTGGQPAGDVDHRVLVEVQARDGVGALRGRRLLLDR